MENKIICKRCNGTGKLSVNLKRNPMEEGILKSHFTCFVCNGKGTLPSIKIKIIWK